MISVLKWSKCYEINPSLSWNDVVNGIGISIMKYRNGFSHSKKAPEIF